MRKFFTIIITMLAAMAEAQETFTIATLNVDGLPLNVLGRDVNPDGPGSEGSVRISEYLAKKGYDMVMMQEDFNYHEELATHLTDEYALDEWSGGVNVEDYDFTNPNFRFACDGLMAAVRTLTDFSKRTAWEDYYGRMDHAWDGMVTKGFRRYELTLAGGTEIVVYNMHMDAEDEGDDVAGDREARKGQWQQLCEEITEKLDERPIIVVGDMNSLYDRDPIRELFTDKISATGKATVGDAWVEIGEGDETLDKIMYVNPTGGTGVKPIAYECDREGYRYDGKPLGDHYPVAVTFEVVKGETGIAAIRGSEVERLKSPQVQGYHDLTGRRVTEPKKGIYINKEHKVVVY